MQQSAAMGIAAVGIAFVILTAGIDLSIGSSMYLGAVIAAYLASKGAAVIPSILISMACGAIVGALNGVLIAKCKVVPFIATLASMSIITGIGSTLTQGNLVYFTGSTRDYLTNANVFGIPIIAFMFIVALIVGQVVLTKTVFGRETYAIGNNSTIAQKVGINLTKGLFAVYIISGVMSGLSGFLSTAQSGAVNPTFGFNTMFLVISAVVLGGISLSGGKGNILPGVLIGVLIIACIQNELVLVGANPYFYTVLMGIVVFLAVMISSINHKGELR
jgi:ribose transport system permease protein